MGTKSEPTEIGVQVGRVTDIGATWRSSLNVCQGELGVQVWGERQGQYWECQGTANNFDLVDLIFAEHQITCRPLFKPDQGDEKESVLVADHMNSVGSLVNISYDFYFDQRNGVTKICY